MTRTSIAQRISLLAVYTGSRTLTRRNVQLVVEGLEYVPRSGPVLIAARHFHHLYDGCILLTTMPRKLHILVALDWVQSSWLRWLMEWACAMVEWPTILRSERLGENEASDSRAGRSAYSLDQSRRYLRRAVMDSVRLLRNGEVLLVFPEAYPNIDPAFTPKNDNTAFLPFRPGFARLVEMAEKDKHTHVAIVPAGLAYVQNEHTMSSKSDERRDAPRREDIVWHVTLRFGPALSLRDYTDSAQLIQAIEEQVTVLSSSVDSPASHNTEEIIHS